MMKKPCMFGLLSIPGRGPHNDGLPLRLLVACFLLVSSNLLLAAQQPPALATQQPPARLLDQQPFDRITLNASNGNEMIDTLLLEIPNRTVPDPLPSNGSLELRRLSEPSVLYTVSWASIARVQFYEQLLLAEAVKLSKTRDLIQAYEYLNFLHKNYPRLDGLQRATEKYLRQDALAAYAKKDDEESLSILLALYDLNPQHAGLKRFVEGVTDRLIKDHLAARDFAAARGVLDLLSAGFPQLPLTNIRDWQGKFEKGASRQLSLARQAIDDSRFLPARRALRQALAILPTVAGANEMLDEIDRKSPQIIVGVNQFGSLQHASNTLDWSTVRAQQLTNPKLLNLVGFGAEGGIYTSPWAELISNDSGLQLDLKLNPAAIRQGITPEILALELLRLAKPTEPVFRADFAGLLHNVEIRQGNQVRIHWKHSHVRPESLLPVALQSITRSANTPGAYEKSLDQENQQILQYQLPQGTDNASGPETLVEQIYDNEEVALADLLSGEVDVLARIPPWQVDRLQQTDGIVVSPYRLPTIHVLFPNYAKPIMGRREFRRALCYGINRPQILKDILLGGKDRAGFRVLSGPLPAGITLTDPVGYAYNQGLQPRTYEPRLASVLSTVTRNSLAKQAALKKSAPKTDQEPEGTKKSEPITPPATPLVLVHPPNPLARTVCQTIKLQLDAIGIPIQLRQLPTDAAQSLESQPLGDYDLRYAELALWEPIVDARRLLGPHGLAGNCSSSMSLALRDVDQAKNWKQARTRLQEVHQIAFYDLPVIPLWQTIDYFAYRENLQGVASTPVTLYQNVANWKRATRRASR